MVLRVKIPSISVIVPIVVPLTTIDTPGKDSPDELSVTLQILIFGVGIKERQNQY